MRGATTLYNTYWVRFARVSITHDHAVANCRALFSAAGRAGVRRIVHVSVTNPTIDSPYPYFRGKALVERVLAESGLSYAVLRPAVIFGHDDVLLNNIAWLLRHLPVFAIGGRGDYRLRPIHVEDLAQLCIDAGTRHENTVTDAVGPERPTYLQLVQLIRTAIRSRARMIHVPGAVVPPLAAGLGTALRDVLLTRNEYHALADGLADTNGPPTGETAVSSWIDEHRDGLGRHYANELDIHFR
jgi:NADH dehydrogenase